MPKDEFKGVEFPNTYNGLLKLTKDCMLANRRFAAMVGNQSAALESIVAAYQSADALELHRLLDHYILAKQTAGVITKAQQSAGITVFQKVR